MDYYEKQPNSDWRTSGQKHQLKGQATNNPQENLSDLSYKCRYLLNKADALYSKGDFENALVLYHKGHRLRPKAPEFRLGIVKTEDALKVMFAEREKQLKKHEKEEQSKEKQISKPQDQQNHAKGTENTAKSEAEKKPGSRKSDKVQKDSPDSAKTAENKQQQPSSQGQTETGNSDTDYGKGRFMTAEQKEKIKASLAERKERIRDARLQFAIKEREEARKIRAKYTGRPSGHLSDDMEFLRMIYKNLKTNTVPNRKVQKITKEAIGYIDTRNNFWNQQMPHHIREKSHVIQLPKGKTPPPTQAMFAFVIKETTRINTMMEKSQWYRSIETSKKLIEHIGSMERKIPKRESIIANIFSIIGNAHLELGEDKKALKFHLKDLTMSSDYDLEEAKSRALDNVGRVYVKLGEYDKAVAVWEQKISSDLESTPGERAWIFHEMGYCYLELERMEKAKECGEKALEAATEKNDQKWQLNANLLIAQALLRSGEAYQSKDQFEKCLKLAIEFKDKEAQTNIEAALKEIDDVLAEWDYMDDEEDELQNSDEEVDQETQPDNTKNDSHEANLEAQEVKSSTPHDQGKESGLHQANKSPSAKTVQSEEKAAVDMLHVEEEHKTLSQQGIESGDEINEDIEKVPEERPVEAVYLGAVRDEPPTHNKNTQKKDTKPSLISSNNKGNVSSRYIKTIKKGKMTIVKESTKPQETGTAATVKKPNPAKTYGKEAPKRENSNSSLLATKPIRQKSNVSLKQKQSREPSFSKSSQSREPSFSKPSQAREPSFSKPAKSREPSFSKVSQSREQSFSKSPKSREQSFSKPSKSREPSFTKAPTRELSNQSMRGKLSREGSNVSKTKTNTSKPKSNDAPKDAHMPSINTHEHAAVIYLNKSPKKTAGKAAGDAAAGAEHLLQKPSKADIQFSDKAIDLVAEMNDPKKTFVESDDENID